MSVQAAALDAVTSTVKTGLTPIAGAAGAAGAVGLSAKLFTENTLAYWVNFLDEHHLVEYTNAARAAQRLSEEDEIDDSIIVHMPFMPNLFGSVDNIIMLCAKDGASKVEADTALKMRSIASHFYRWLEKKLEEAAKIVNGVLKKVEELTAVLEAVADLIKKLIDLISTIRPSASASSETNIEQSVESSVEMMTPVPNIIGPNVNGESLIKAMAILHTRHDFTREDLSRLRLVLSASAEAFSNACTTLAEARG